jgi:integrase/recombinase XerD
MGEADVRVAVGGVLVALREAGRSEGTIRRHQVVLDRFAAFLAGRGLVTASPVFRTMLTRASPT